MTANGHTKTIGTAAAQVVHWLVIAKRMLLIVWPFLAIITVLVWLAITSIDILAAGRAYVEGESLWSKSQKEAVSHLLRYAESGAESDYRKYQLAIQVPVAYRQARIELQKPDRDDAIVRAALLEGGTHPDDIPGVIRLYDRFHDVAYMARVLEIWRTGDKFLTRIQNAARDLYAVHQSDTVTRTALEPILQRILRINEEIRPWQNGFSNTLGEATRWMQTVLLLVVVAAASTLVPVGLFVTHRMLVRVERGEQERKRLEEQLRQAQKMEAIGQLAGGIAHDFNNLLTVINAYSQLVLMNMDPDHPHRQDLVEILRSGERAASLTHQLLAFSRKQPISPTILDLNLVLSEMTEMLGRLLREDITLDVHTDPLLGPVKADAGQIEQVIMNLSVNARDAMPRGGHLTIETRNVELDGSFAQAHPEIKPGPHVLLSVSDTGEGMDGATRSRIFEPFFTTKENGRGTGLGLATVYGIVKQSGGTIEVESDVGRGTTFKVYLPRAAEAEVRVDSARAGGETPGGSETILLVEDEEQVRKVAVSILELKGYRVRQAANGAQALAMCQLHGGEVDLLVTDVVMPGMTGPDLAERLLSPYPGLKVLMVSGYPDRVIANQGVLKTGIHFLKKPFTPDTLARKVRDALDKHPAGSGVAG